MVQLKLIIKVSIAAKTATFFTVSPLKTPGTNCHCKCLVSLQVSCKNKTKNTGFKVRDPKYCLCGPIIGLNLHFN